MLEKLNIPPEAMEKIENEIYNSIVQVYGENQSKTIYEHVMQIAKKEIETRPEELKQEDLTRADDWYKPYCQIANHLSEQGYTVFVSSHEVVRRELEKSKEPVYVIFPAIDLARSSTRRDDLLLNQREQEAAFLMHRALSGLKSDEAVERIIDLFIRTRNNEEFIEIIKKTKIV